MTRPGVGESHACTWQAMCESSEPRHCPGVGTVLAWLSDTIKRLSQCCGVCNPCGTVHRVRNIQKQLINTRKGWYCFNTTACISSTRSRCPPSDFSLHCLRAHFKGRNNTRSRGEYYDFEAINELNDTVLGGSRTKVSKVASHIQCLS